MSLREDILATLRKMAPYAEALGSLEGLRHLADAAAGGSDASLLRQQYEREGSVEAIVHASINWFRGERRFWRR